MNRHILRLRGYGSCGSYVLRNWQGLGRACSRTGPAVSLITGLCATDPFKGFDFAPADGIIYKLFLNCLP